MSLRFTLGDWVNRSGGRLIGVDPSAPVGQMVVDSRAVEPGSLFCALPGRYEHGRRYARSAVQAGAVAVLLEPPVEADVPCWVNDNPLHAMAGVGRLCLEAIGARVVGITGSVGKTSTKVLTRAVLSSRFQVEATPKNFNTQIGLPLALTALQPRLDWFVAEMAMRARGEIRALTRIAPPDVAVITNIGPAHLSELGSLDAIMEAKAEILAGLKPGGIAVMNGDDARLRTLAERVSGQVLWYGQTAADVRIVQVTSGPGFVRVELGDAGGAATLTVPWDGAYQAHNIAAAAAVGRALGPSWAEIGRGLATVQEDAGHFRRVQVGSLWILDDTYNASPASMEGGLDVLAGEPGRR
ncbi:MAG: UDP-N-acetylmuramoyl-tripeptide--D-alanyl-D-alanine ligase, partial [Clostridia bacterium]